jgi:hypothetical protein
MSDKHSVRQRACVRNRGGAVRFAAQRDWLCEIHRGPFTSYAQLQTAPIQAKVSRATQRLPTRPGIVRSEPESRHDGLAAEASSRFRSYSPLEGYSGKFPESRRVLTRAFRGRQQRRRVVARHAWRSAERVTRSIGRHTLCVSSFFSRRDHGKKEARGRSRSGSARHAAHAPGRQGCPNRARGFAQGAWAHAAIRLVLADTPRCNGRRARGGCYETQT